MYYFDTFSYISFPLSYFFGYLYLVFDHSTFKPPPYHLYGMQITTKKILCLRSSEERGLTGSFLYHNNPFSAVCFPTFGFLVSLFVPDYFHLILSFLYQTTITIKAFKRRKNAAEKKYLA